MNLKKKIIFKKNTIPYGQDFKFFVGIPYSIEFTVQKDTIQTLKLTGHHYGAPGNYGNGAIYVNPANIRKEDLLEEDESVMVYKAKITERIKKLISPKGFAELDLIKRAAVLKLLE